MSERVTVAAKLCGAPLDGDVMRQVALGMADGQLHQADVLLCDPWHVKRGRSGGGRDGETNLVRALLHMRSACKWMQAVA